MGWTLDVLVARHVITHSEQLTKAVKTARLAAAGPKPAAADGHQQSMADSSAELAELVRSGLDGAVQSFWWLLSNKPSIGRDFGKSAEDAVFELLSVYSLVRTGATEYAALGIRGDQVFAELRAMPDDDSIQAQCAQIRVRRALLQGTITGTGDYVDGRIDDHLAGIRQILSPFRS